MHLTKIEEKMLKGEYGEGLKFCMEYLVKYGETVDADCFVPIKYSHISGVSPNTIGKAGLKFRKYLSDLDLKVLTDTSLNPRSMSLDKKQTEILNIYKKLGVDLTLTCSPEKIWKYKGQIIACAESSLSCFGNSVVGVKTNRESGAFALIEAITGRVPHYGYHLEENRMPNITVKVLPKLSDISEWSALGFYIGEKFKKRIVPYFYLKSHTLTGLQNLAAGLVTKAPINMFHVKGLSKEKTPKEKVVVDKKDIKSIYEELSDDVEKIDFVFIGCPHLTQVYSLRQKMQSFTFQIFGRDSYSCPVVSELKGECIATNSAKAAYYLKNILGKKVLFTTTKECFRLLSKPIKKKKIAKKFPEETISIKSKPYVCLKHGVEYIEDIKAKTESTAFADVAFCGKDFILKLPDPSFVK